MRSYACLALLPFIAACTSTSSVPAGSMTAMQSPTADTTVLRDADGEPIRLDANSELRFERTDGSWTPWRSAAELWANREGVLIPYLVRASDLERAAVAGASEADEDDLRAAAGPNDHTEYNGNDLVMHGAIAPWLARYVASHPTPSGTWSFRAKDGTWFQNFAGVYVPKVAHDGVRVNDGLRFSDMTSAEVKNVSGGKTLVGVAAVTAVAVAIVPLVVLTKGELGKIPFNVGAAVVETGARVAVHASFHGCCVSGGKAAPTVYRKSDDGGGSLWTPGYEPPGSDGAHRIFTSNARRRATVRLGAIFDYASAVTLHGPWSATIAGMIRFTDLVDLGAGVRALGVGSASDRIVFARVGVHAELDAHRRFALPLSVDLGGGGPVTFHGRINFGLRVRVVDAWWIGLHPLNPTYTRYDSGARLSGVPYWSFPSMIETTFAF